MNKLFFIAIVLLCLATPICNTMIHQEADQAVIAQFQKTLNQLMQQRLAAYTTGIIRIIYDIEQRIEAIKCEMRKAGIPESVTRSIYIKAALNGS